MHQNTAGGVMPDYFGILLRAVRGADSNTVAARAQAYDIARGALNAELSRLGLEAGGEQAAKERAALEQAIWRIETLALRNNDKRSALERLREEQSSRSLKQRDLSPPGNTPPAQTRSHEIALPPRTAIATDDEVTFERRRRRGLGPFADDEDGNVTIYEVPSQSPKAPGSLPRLLALLGEVSRTALVAVGAVALYVLISETNDGSRKLPAQVSKTDLEKEAGGSSDNAVVSQRSTALMQAPNGVGAFPRPQVYGVYAVHDEQLTELNIVATTPVDPRAKTIVQINQPSSTSMQTGKLKFVLYRRDLSVSAPEKVSLRIVAKLARAMKFDGAGTIVTVPQRETWVIRSGGYELRVLPVPDDREMIVVRPDDPQFSVPPGRYALMVSGQPYDFVVNGAVRDPAHCVESAPTERGPIFYDCPPK